MPDEDDVELPDHEDVDEKLVEELTREIKEDVDLPDESESDEDEPETTVM